MSALEIGTLDRETCVSQPSMYCGWFLSGWLRLSLLGVLFLAMVTGLITGAPDLYMVGQVLLCLSAFIALSFLADRPLLNPIQIFVFGFYWWFGVGPAAISTFKIIANLHKEALAVQVDSMEALWIVAPGLLLYAIVARGTLRFLSGKGFYARFLLPSEENFSTKVLIIYTALTTMSSSLLMLLSTMGIMGLEETSILGGTKTTIWWVGVIAAIGAINPMVKSSLMTYLAKPLKTIPYVVKILIAIAIGQTIMFALFGGWKGPIALLCALYVFAYMGRFQRPPWTLIIVAAVFFVLVITPYVSYGRHAAIVSGVGSNYERKNLFLELLKTPELFLPTMDQEIDVAVLFRGIAPLAAELTRRNSFFEGEWGGSTITWGFEILVPRAIMPEKRDMNIGNFFARTVGADIGVSLRYDFVNNIAISIPFEFLGNFGWSWGILSFGIIGFFWPLLCVWLFSIERLSTHPFVPFMGLFMMGMEAPLGHFLVQVRSLIIPLLAFFFINKVILRGRI